MGRGIFVKQNGTWVEVAKPAYNNAGTYTPIIKGFVNVDGIWQQFFPVTGNAEWIVPGAYTFKVPTGISKITVDMCGGGGGGGGSNEVGAGGGGGGGGSGGSYSKYDIAVTSGETLTIKVGEGGTGAPFIGRTSAAPAGTAGTSSSITAQSGITVATGGAGGLGGFTNGAGTGGAGGTPMGDAGENGTGNKGESDQLGGAGGSSLFGTGGPTPPLSAPNGINATGYGSGGSGGSAKNYAQPLNWTGGDGTGGYVRISW